MFVDNINSNLHRVHSVFTRLDDAQDTFTLKHLVKEELLSPEQLTNISKHKDKDLYVIAVVIKETKTGQCLKFLPLI